jgi:hypothetical protein
MAAVVRTYVDRAVGECLDLLHHASHEIHLAFASCDGEVKAFIPLSGQLVFEPKGRSFVKTQSAGELAAEGEDQGPPTQTWREAKEKRFDLQLRHNTLAPITQNQKNVEFPKASYIAFC